MIINIVVNDNGHIGKRLSGIDLKINNDKAMESCVVKVYDRAQAGMLLGSKLRSYHNTNAVVLGISKGGALVAHAIANSLNLPLEIFPCRKIMRPGDAQRSIGSVSLDGIVIHAHPYDVPQDYIRHQAIKLQNELRHEVNYYGKKWDLISLEDRTVIIVDDVMRSGDTMTACLRSIKDRHPAKVIVAVPFVSAESVLLIEETIDEVFYIRMETAIDSPSDFFEYFPTVDESSVKSTLRTARKMILEL